MSSYSLVSIYVDGDGVGAVRSTGHISRPLIKLTADITLICRKSYIGAVRNILPSVIPASRYNRRLLRAIPRRRYVAATNRDNRQVISAGIYSTDSIKVETI